MTRLEDIIKDCGAVSVSGDRSVAINSVTCDSRKAGLGCMFIAVKGFSSDGHRYIGDAVAAGAAAIVYEDSEAAAPFIGAAGAPAFVKVSSSRHAEAVIASNFYGKPSEKLTLVGITGTNGKTTTVTLLYRMFTAMGYSCGLLSTIANYVGTKRYEAVNTTSDPITINSLLAEMADAGCEYCFMEVSSIGVQQERIAGLRFKAGIFSNLTHDHLDYHKTFAEYLRCKKLFFDNLPEDAYAITNIDDRNGMVMVQNTKAHVVTYSCRSMADHTARVMEESFEGMMLKVDGRETWTNLIGMHNAYNILAVYTTAIVLGAGQEEALVAISSLRSAPGRLENLRGPRGISVVIDYAHTPDALENILTTVRDFTKGRVICLFGCGGDRDRSKRPQMGAIAGQLADVTVVTSDNPRTEEPQAIIQDILKGMEGTGAQCHVEPDRRRAIALALSLAQAGDTVVLAGKGHETYQEIGGVQYHLDEREGVASFFAGEKQNFVAF